MTPFPWRHWFVVNPQASTRRPCFDFSRRIGRPFLSGLFPLVLLVVPGHPGLDLLQADIAAVSGHLSNHALVAVELHELYRHGSAGDHRSQASLRSTAERLSPFWGVDSRQPDLVLPVGAVQHRDRIAVGNGDHPAD